MDSELARFLAVSLIVLTTLALLLRPDWRWSILALAGQYLGVFLLVWVSWPLEMAVVKLVAGWMAGAVLGTTWLNNPDSEADIQRPVNRLFFLLAGGLVLLVAFSLAPRVLLWVPDVGLEQVAGGLVLIGMGMLHLGFTASSFRLVLGLLTLLSGFEIIYAAVESSTLVAGLLAGVNLGLALVGSYMLVAPTLEGAE